MIVEFLQRCRRFVRCSGFRLPSATGRIEGRRCPGGGYSRIFRLPRGTCGLCFHHHGLDNAANVMTGRHTPYFIASWYIPRFIRYSESSSILICAKQRLLRQLLFCSSRGSSCKTPVAPHGFIRIPDDGPCDQSHGIRVTFRNRPHPIAARSRSV